MTNEDIAVPASSVTSTRVGALVTVRGADGFEYRARVLRVENLTVVVRPFEKLDLPSESPLRLTLVQALPKREKMSFIVEKAVELGACCIMPCYSAKSERETLGEKGQDKSHKWQLTMARAVEQCRRQRMPELTPIKELAEIIKSFEGGNVAKVMLYEKETTNHLKDLLSTIGLFQKVVLVCGPEGGFAEDEVLAARLAGFATVRLGGRVLRCETAAVAAMSILQHEWGDL